MSAHPPGHHSPGYDLKEIHSVGNGECELSGHLPQCSLYGQAMGVKKEWGVYIPYEWNK